MLVLSIVDDPPLFYQNNSMISPTPYRRSFVHLRQFSPIADELQRETRKYLRPPGDILLSGYHTVFHHFN